MCFFLLGNTYCFASYIHCLRGFYKIAASVHRSFVCFYCCWLAKDVLFVCIRLGLNLPILISETTSFEKRNEKILPFLIDSGSLKVVKFAFKLHYLLPLFWLVIWNKLEKTKNMLTFPCFKLQLKFTHDLRMWASGHSLAGNVLFDEFLHVLQLGLVRRMRKPSVRLELGLLHERLHHARR